MSYQVLARKWRPGRFSELVGQEHVVSAISNALENNRLHHAYLFTGTRGVGKTTIARIFSKSLNCEQGQSANPCGQCSTCVEIEQGNYVDLLEIDAASRTKVEDTREILDNVQYKPTRGDYKVYLIDEVHMLSKHSFNALLKTLEEPPPHVKFLLATTDPQKLPITILSRCLQFNLKALSREQISKQLQHILDLESVPYESNAIELLAKAAMGSMRDGLSLTDQAIAQGNNQVVSSIVTDMLGLMDRQQLLKILFAITKRDATAVIEQVNDIAMLAPDFNLVLAELASLLHQIALTQWVPEACKLETNTAKAIFQLAKHFAPEQVQVLYQTVLQGRKDLPFASDPRSAFEMTLLRMMTFSPATPMVQSEELVSQTPVQEGIISPITASAIESLDAHSLPDDSTPATPNESDELERQATDLLNEAEDLRLQSEHLTASTPTAYEEHVEGTLLPTEEHSVEHTPLEAPQPPLPVDEPVASAPVTSTSAMLALRQKLKQQAAEEKAETGKKPSSRSSTEALKRDLASDVRSPANVNTEVPVAFKQQPSSQVELTEPSEQAPPPWVLESDLNETGLTQPALPSNDIQSPTVTSTQQLETNANASEAETYNTPVAEVTNLDRTQAMPAYLDNGEKLIKASQIDAWSALVESLPVAGLIKQVALHSLYNRVVDHVTLTLDPNQQHLVNDSTHSELSIALTEVLQSPITMTLNVDPVSNTPFQQQQQINKMRQQHARTIIQTDDTIQSIVGVFNAQVLDESVEPR